MNYREAIEVTLEGRKLARFNGQTYKLDADKLRAFGLDASKVSYHVNRIESFVWAELAAVDGQQSLPKQEG